MLYARFRVLNTFVSSLLLRALRVIVVAVTQLLEHPCTCYYSALSRLSWDGMVLPFLR